MYYVVLMALKRKVNISCSFECVCVEMKSLYYLVLMASKRKVNTCMSCCLEYMCA